MEWTAASLAAVTAVLALGAIGCGGDGAEPDAPGSGREPVPISLILDFQPNAVHSGIYAAVAEGRVERAGIELQIREPGSSSDAPKLLEAGRTDLAIMDVNDLGIARERGAPIVAVGSIVQRPLAAVIAADRDAVRTPADLEGATVGVTGLPSDDAVIDSVIGSAAVDPSAVDRQTIGFESVPLLAAGRVAAATAFWNAEGVTLREQGIPTREFRVDDYGAPRYPELVLVTTEERLAAERGSIEATIEALEQGYSTVVQDPIVGLAALMEAEPELYEPTQREQLEALLRADAFSPPLVLDRDRIEAWADWALGEGILEEPLDVGEAFDLGG